MAYTTEEYADTLLRLTGSARWPEARTDLLKTISSDQLGDIAMHCMHTNLSWEGLEEALCNLLDSIARKRKVAQGTPGGTTIQELSRPQFTGVPTITEAGGAELNSELHQGYGNDKNASSIGSRIFDEHPSATSTPRMTYTPAQLTAASPTHIDTETEHASGDTPTRVHSPEHAEAENDKSDNPLRDLWLSRDVVSRLTAKLRLRVKVQTRGNGYR